MYVQRLLTQLPLTLYQRRRLPPPTKLPWFCGSSSHKALLFNGYHAVSLLLQQDSPQVSAIKHCMCVFLCLCDCHTHTHTHTHAIPPKHSVTCVSHCPPRWLFSGSCDWRAVAAPGAAASASRDNRHRYSGETAPKAEVRKCPATTSHRA